MLNLARFMITEADIIAVIKSVAPDKKLEPAVDDSLFDSGLLDSFALPDLVTALERKFGVKIPDSDLVPRKFDTVSRIQTYLESRL